MATRKYRAQSQNQEALAFNDGDVGLGGDVDTRADVSNEQDDGGLETPSVALSTYAATAGAKGTLKKANESIVMVPVNGDFIFLGRKAWNVLLYHAQQQGLASNARFGIPVSLLASDAGFNSKNIEFLKKRLRSLVTTSIEWGWIADSLEGAPKSLWSVTTLMADAEFEINPQTRELWLYWSYSSVLKQQLLNSNAYTKLSIAMMARLRTLPALSIYELAARYLTSPGRTSKKAKWEEWVVILRGKKFEEYPTLDYRRFKKETLNLATAQVNAEQDEFEVKFEEFKTGKKVTHIRLVVTPLKKLGVQDEPDAEVRGRMDMSLFNAMLEMGIHQYAADSIYAMANETVLREALDQLRARLANHRLPAVNSPEAYLRERVRSLSQVVEDSTSDAEPTVDTPSVEDTSRAGESKDHGEPSSPEHEQEIAEANSASAQADTEQAFEPEFAAPAEDESERRRLAERIAGIKIEYDAYHRARAREMFSEALPGQRQAWIDRFQSERVANGPESLRQAFNKRGIEAPLVSSHFYKWLAESTWNPNPSDMDLIEWGFRRGVIQVNPGN